MAYRYSDTLKWQDEWFVDLSSIEKLLFMYLCDNCDIAGFFELSYRKIAFDLNSKEAEIKGAIKGLEKAVFMSDDEKCLLVKNFIRHQKNIPINPDNKAHQGILKRISIYLPKFTNVTLNYQEGYLGKGANKPLERGTANAIGIDNGNAVKHSLEEREKFFKTTLFPFIKSDKNPEGLYTKEIVKEFFEYWKEPNKSKTKMRYEMEKTWDVKLRLNRWGSNNFNKTPQQQIASTHYEPVTNRIDHSNRD
jgi:hypothetical protein